MEEINSTLTPVAENGPARLDHFVRRRTAQMRISPRELSSRGGPNRTTLHKAINGTGRLRESTLTRIDNSLGWAPGSAARILAGGLPETRMTTSGHDDHAVTVITASLDILHEVKELVDKAEGLLQELIGDHRARRQAH